MNLHEILEKRDKAENHFDSLMAMAQSGDLNALNQLPQACTDLVNIVGELAHGDFNPKFSSGYQSKPRFNDNKIKHPQTKK